MFKFASFGSSINISFNLQGAETRKMRQVKGVSGGSDMLPVYSGFEPINGNINIDCGGKRIEHSGIKIEAVGQIELYKDNKSSPKDVVKFSYIVRELRTPGVMSSNETHPFEFNGERVHETFRGKCMSLRYFLRCTVSRPMTSGGNVVKEIDIAIENQPPVQAPALDSDDGIKMEVGIEDCLHIEFEFDKQKYALMMLY